MAVRPVSGYGGRAFVTLVVVTFLWLLPLWCTQPSRVEPDAEQRVAAVMDG